MATLILFALSLSTPLDATPARIRVACATSAPTYGIDPVRCIAVAWVESRWQPHRQNGRHLGVGQVSSANLFVARRAYAPAAGPWAIWSAEGGVEASMRMLAAWERKRPGHTLAGYACGNEGACASYVRAVMEAERRLLGRCRRET
jgi:hypothetical protein